MSAIVEKKAWCFNFSSFSVDPVTLAFGLRSLCFEHLLKAFNEAIFWHKFHNSTVNRFWDICKNAFSNAWPWTWPCIDLNLWLSVRTELHLLPIHPWPSGVPCTKFAKVLSVCETLMEAYADWDLTIWFRYTTDRDTTDKKPLKTTCLLPWTDFKKCFSWFCNYPRTPLFRCSQPRYSVIL